MTTKSDPTSKFVSTVAAAAELKVRDSTVRKHCARLKIGKVADRYALTRADIETIRAALEATGKRGPKPGSKRA